jgi:purine-binding chemotaxis protein CheW
MPMTKESNLNVLQNGENLVIFRLNLVHYAITVETIRQIIEMVTITPVLKTETWMEGVINYHGHSIPVVNLRRHFGMEIAPYRWHTPIILVDILEHLVGLIVDDVLDVTVASDEQIINPHSILPPGVPETPLLKNLILADNKIILLLDLAHLFDQNQVQALAATVGTLGEQPEQVIIDKAKKSVTLKQQTDGTKKKAKKVARAPRAAASPKKEKPAAQKRTQIAPPETGEL